MVEGLKRYQYLCRCEREPQDSGAVKNTDLPEGQKMKFMHAFIRDLLIFITACCSNNRRCE